jgi:hypothetical protein
MQTPSENTAQAALPLWGGLSPILYRLLVPAQHAKIYVCIVPVELFHIERGFYSRTEIKEREME